MLQQSEAFMRDAGQDREEIARNTAIIADYLARPEGIEGNRIPGGLACRRRRPSPAAAGRAAVDSADRVERQIGERGELGRRARRRSTRSARTSSRRSAAREGAKVAGMLLNEVNFPAFVAGLIKGVFMSIVKCSIEQMEAYRR